MTPAEFDKLKGFLNRHKFSCVWFVVCMVLGVVWGASFLTMTMPVDVVVDIPIAPDIVDRRPPDHWDWHRFFSFATGPAVVAVIPAILETLSWLVYRWRSVIRWGVK